MTLTTASLIQHRREHTSTSTPIACLIGNVSDRAALLTLPGVRETTAGEWRSAIMRYEIPASLMWDDPTDGRAKPVRLTRYVRPGEVYALHERALVAGWVE